MPRVSPCRRLSWTVASRSPGWGSRALLECLPESSEKVGERDLYSEMIAINTTRAYINIGPIRPSNTK